MFISDSGMAGRVTAIRKRSYLGLVDTLGWLIGAAGLLLALWVYLEGRRAARRAEVNNVSVFCEIKRPSSLQSTKMEARTRAKNANEQPIEITWALWRINTRWKIPFAQWSSGEREWRTVFRAEESARYIEELPVVVPPQEEWKEQWVGVDVTRLAPDPDALLDPSLD